MNIKKFKGSELIKYIGKNNCKTLGNTNLVFNQISPINTSSENNLTFCSLKRKNAFNLIQETKANIILYHEDLLKYNIKLKNKLIIAVDNPRLWFIRCIQYFFPPIEKKGIHPTALIGKNCKIGNEIYIDKYVCIGNNVQIGNRSKIYSGVHIYDNVIIGNHVVINSGCVIGADGFGYERNENKILEKFPHLGTVIIEDFVEIGSNTSIDRGSLSNTKIGEGTKIDNLVHIAHNVRIGKHCEIIANAMLGGSVIIGDYTRIAPGTQIINGVSIGKNVLVGLGAVVIKDIPDNTTVAGVPAREINEYRKYLKFIKNNI